MFQDTLWWEWLLVSYFVVIGPLVSYFGIRFMTKIMHTRKSELTGTEIIDGKFVISNPKKFLPIFVIFSIIGLPALVVMFIWIIVTED